MASLIDALPERPELVPANAYETALLEAFDKTKEDAARAIRSFMATDDHPNSNNYKMDQTLAVTLMGRCLGLWEAIQLLPVPEGSE